MMSASFLQPLGIGHLVAVGHRARRSPPASRACRPSCSRSRRRPWASGSWPAPRSGRVPSRHRPRPRSARTAACAAGQCARTLSTTSMAEAHAVQLAAAILVVAHVGERREELVDQVAVRAVDIEHVEARLVGAPRRLAPALDDLRDLGARERARRRIGVGRVDAARRDQLPALPVPDLRRRLRAARRPPTAGSAAPCGRNGRAGCRAPNCAGG